MLQLEAAQTERIAELKRNLLRYTDELYAENHSMFEMHIRNMATEKLATAHYGPVMLLALGKVYVTQAKRSRGNVGAYFRRASHLLFTCCSPAVHLLFTCCSPAVHLLFQSSNQVEYVSSALETPSSCSATPSIGRTSTCSNGVSNIRWVLAPTAVPRWPEGLRTC